MPSPWHASIHLIGRDSGHVAILRALATGALCSLAPAFADFGTNVKESLKEGARSVRAARATLWFALSVRLGGGHCLVLLTVSGALLLELPEDCAQSTPDFRLPTTSSSPAITYPSPNIRPVASSPRTHAVVDRLSTRPESWPSHTSGLPRPSFCTKFRTTIEGASVTVGAEVRPLRITYGDYFKKPPHRHAFSP